MTQHRLFMFRNPEGGQELLVSTDFDSHVIHAGFSAEVWYGSEPDSGEVASIRKKLHEKAAKSVELWMSQQRFIPKFLVSALVFGVVYFFMALVVRDPIPFLDEFVAAVLASVLTFVFMTRRDRSSILAAEAGGEVRARVDAIRFVPHASMENLEDFLAGLKGREHEPLDRVLEDLNNLLRSFDLPVSETLLELARGEVVIRLPSKRQVNSLLENGLSLQTWVEWCRTKRISPWLGLLAVVGSSRHTWAR